MNKEYKTFVDILNSYINNTSLSTIENVDPAALVKLADIHNVTGILAAINRKYNLQIFNDYAAQLDTYMFSAIKMSVIWDGIYSEISSSLAEHKIKNIVVKGPAVKRYYPDPDLRTMGDIDLVIHSSDIPDAIKAIESLGFESENGSIDEYKLIRNGLCVELHEDLTSKDLGTGIDYKTEMQNLFNNVKNPDEYIQELTDEYHLIYLLLHMAHHLIASGCGVRQLMDVALTIKNVPLDFDYIWKELDKLKLTDLAHCIFYLCHRWFGIKCDDYIMSEDVYISLSEHILEGGVFGHAVERRNDTIMMESIYNGKIKTLVGRFFPDVTEACSRVVWFRNKPACFLPIAWIYNWCAIFNKSIKSPKRIASYVKFLFNKNNSRASEEYKILQTMGFYKNSENVTSNLQT